MRIFLLHGMARTAASMVLLSWRLRRAGYATTAFGYHTVVEDLEAMSARLVTTIRRKLEGDGTPDGPYAIIGHSLGCIITRQALPELPPGCSHFVMLAPPNQPPILARKFKRNLLFRALTRDAGRKLADPSFYDQLPEPSEIPTLIIAGTAGPSARWLPFQGEINDGIVSLPETRLDGLPRIQVGGIHSFLMNRRDVLDHILEFLRQDRPPSPNPPTTASPPSSVAPASATSLH